MTLPITVLKFGGSVLSDAASLRTAAIEIYRHTRRGRRVVAVVSAVRDHTERLLRLSDEITRDPDPHLKAGLIAIGEQRAAAALALAVDAAGLEVVVLHERDLKLTADGDPMEATPRSVDEITIHRALANSSVVVVPGFVATNALGQTVLLGRGGSDLTALFLAFRLNAERCLLLKDVDGWFDQDPSVFPGTRRFASLSFVDALARRDPVVQERAVRFAAQARRTFEVGAIESRAPTEVGDVPTRLEVSPARFGEDPRLRQRKVALLGLGAVGMQIFHLLSQRTEHLSICAVLVRDLGKIREVDVGAETCLTAEYERVLATSPDLIVEALPDEAVAYPLVERALQLGIDVVSANKALIEARGLELREIADARGARLRYGATVGGAIPMLETLETLGRSGAPRAIRAVLNGTSGFVLDQILGGSSAEGALALARQRGYAEEDARADLDGQDAARKLALLLQACGDRRARLHDIEYSGIDGASDGPARMPRLVAKAQVQGPRQGRRAAPSVALEFLHLADPLAVSGIRCALEVETHDGQRHVLRGRGAGGYPTAVSLLCDVLEAER